MSGLSPTCEPSLAKLSQPPGAVIVQGECTQLPPSFAGLAGALLDLRSTALICIGGSTGTKVKLPTVNVFRQDWPIFLAALPVQKSVTCANQAQKTIADVMGDPVGNSNPKCLTWCEVDAQIFVRWESKTTTFSGNSVTVIRNLLEAKQALTRQELFQPLRGTNPYRNDLINQVIKDLKELLGNEAIQITTISRIEYIKLIPPKRQTTF